MAQYGNQIPVDEPDEAEVLTPDGWQEFMRGGVREDPDTAKDVLSPGRAYGNVYVEPQQ